MQKASLREDLDLELGAPEIQDEGYKRGRGSVAVPTEMGSARQQTFSKPPETSQRPGNIPEELPRGLKPRTPEFANQHSLSWKNPNLPSADGHSLNSDATLHFFLTMSSSQSTFRHC